MRLTLLFSTLTGLSTAKGSCGSKWRAFLFATVSSTGGSWVRIANGARSFAELAEQGNERFEEILVSRLASHYRKSEADIQAIVAEWMEVRPLKYLKDCRYAGVKELLSQLRSTGKIIGVLSDYPAQDKLSRLELEADFVLSARDEHVAALKPNPRGLQHLMAITGVGPEATVMIGDRAERDGEMGRRAGVKTYLRSSAAIPVGIASAHSTIFSNRRRASENPFFKGAFDHVFSRQTSIDRVARARIHAARLGRVVGDLSPGGRDPRLRHDLATQHP
jgi:HAD superfamily hydrolase (TIGR01549 family)